MTPRLFCTTAALLLAAPAAYAAGACRLALLLAMDVSSSMSERDYALQQGGIAAALAAPEVRAAILSDPARPIALAAYEWSGRNQQKLIVDWTLLDTTAAINTVISQLVAAPRSFTRFPTSMGFSLGYGAGLFKTAPICERKVMDVSGDGINNDGFGPQLAYRHFPFDDVTVNGLVVLGKDPDVEWFYESNVVHGRRSFLQVAQNFEDFERAMSEKLLREISEVMLGQETGPAPAIRLASRSTARRLP